MEHSSFISDSLRSCSWLIALSLMPEATNEALLRSDSSEEDRESTCFCNELTSFSFSSFFRFASIMYDWCFSYIDDSETAPLPPPVPSSL